MIISFLSGRAQSIKISGSSSQPLPIRCGVSKGSILGPLLFLIYISDPFSSLRPLVNKVLDLTNKQTNVSLLMFADDSALIVCAKTAELLVTALSNTILKRNIWMNHNQSNFVVLNGLVIVGLSSVIWRTSSVRYLGSIVDKSLLFKYIEYISKEYWHNSRT